MIVRVELQGFPIGVAESLRPVIFGRFENDEAFADIDLRVDISRTSSQNKEGEELPFVRIFTARARRRLTRYILKKLGVALTGFVVEVEIVNVRQAFGNGVMMRERSHRRLPGAHDGLGFMPLMYFACGAALIGAIVLWGLNALGMNALGL